MVRAPLPKSAWRAAATDDTANSARTGRYATCSNSRSGLPHVIVDIPSLSLAQRTNCPAPLLVALSAERRPLALLEVSVAGSLSSLSPRGCSPAFRGRGVSRTSSSEVQGDWAGVVFAGSQVIFFWLIRPVQERGAGVSRDCSRECHAGTGPAKERCRLIRGSSIRPRTPSASSRRLSLARRRRSSSSSTPDLCTPPHSRR